MSSVTLVCEACPIEGKVIPVTILKNQLTPSITGVSTLIDLHGIDEKANLDDTKPHARILYVDERLTVRSFSIVTSLAKRNLNSLKNDEVLLNTDLCPIEEQVIPVKLSRSQFKPSITGVSTIIDLHGIDEQLKNENKKLHARILYVDEQLNVRSFTVVTALTRRK